MTPDERQLLSGLFDRIRGASTQQRDREAESFIGDSVRSQPYAPYLLAQTVIVQEQALRAANDRLQELEAKVDELANNRGAGSGAGSGGFLGNIGRSIFGQNYAPQGRPQEGYGHQGSAFASRGGQPGGYGQQAGYGQQGGFGQQQGFGQPGGAAQGPMGQGGMVQGGPWGGQQAGGAGGGFLKGALGAAAGVAGGVLLANSISGLFRDNNPLGIASGVPGMGGEAGRGGETVVNNYYGNDDQGSGGGFENADNFDNDDNGSSFDGDDSYNV